MRVLGARIYHKLRLSLPRIKFMRPRKSEHEILQNGEYKLNLKPTTTSLDHRT